MAFLYFLSYRKDQDNDPLGEPYISSSTSEFPYALSRRPDSPANWLANLGGSIAPACLGGHWLDCLWDCIIRDVECVVPLDPAPATCERKGNYIGEYDEDQPGKHCYITGGSKGLGKSLAIQLAQRGANVTIVARNRTDLDRAVAEIRKHCSQPQEQKVVAVQADVTDLTSSKKALEEAVKAMGGDVPQLVFTVAGLSPREKAWHIFDFSVRFHRLANSSTR